MSEIDKKQHEKLAHSAKEGAPNAKTKAEVKVKAEVESDSMREPKPDSDSDSDSDSGSDGADLDEALDLFADAMQLQDLDASKEALAELESLLPESSPELWYGRGQVADLEGDLARARTCFEEAITLDPSDADAFFALSLVLEDLGERDAMVQANLEVLRLDTEQNPAVMPDALRDMICREAENALRSLPKTFTQRLENVAVIVEDRPERQWVAEGFDPRAFGLFAGSSDREHRSIDAPSHLTSVTLFGANLASAFPDEADLREQVRITVFHEVGHFFGLDEDDLDRLELT